MSTTIEDLRVRLDVLKTSRRLFLPPGERARRIRETEAELARLEAAPQQPVEPEPVRPAIALPPPPPKCDRSGDIGTKHIFALDAQDGDRCLCGKRVKVVMEPCHSCHAMFPLHRLTEREVLTMKATSSSPAEYDVIFLCATCLDLADQDGPDEAYERAERSEEWERRGGGGL